MASKAFKKKHQAVLVAAATLPSSSAVFRNPYALLQRQFENQTGDWKLVGCDGKAFFFHKEILSDQVPHFKALFAHQGTTETISKEIYTPVELDMKGPAVEAFLRFVYYQDLEGMKASFEVTSSLIRAGHYFQLQPLTQAATHVLKEVQMKERKWEWFSGEELFKLYQSVWLWEEGHPSKMEVLQCVVTIFQNLSKKKRNRNELLPIVGGNPAAGDLVLAMLGPVKPQKSIQNAILGPHGWGEEDWDWDWDQY